MKRALVLLSAFLLLSSSAFGKERTQTEMDFIAKSAFSVLSQKARTWQGKTAGDNLVSDAVSSVALNRQLREAHPDVNGDYLVVYNFRNGYAIVSTDDRLPALIAFSDSQEFKADMMPPAMQSMLVQYILRMNEGKDNSFTTNRAEANIEVAPLLGEIAFSQDSPYNDKCPLQDGKRTAVGCLATAMAQILAYYRYPTQMLGGKIEYVTEKFGIPVSWDCTKTRFDWDNILDTYSSGPSIPYNANETTTTKQYMSFSDMKVSDENKLEISDLFSRSTETLTGDLQLLLCDNSGRFIRPVGQKCDITGLLPSYGWGTFYIKHSIPGDIDDGEYRLYLGLKLSGSSEWSVMQRFTQDSQWEEYYINLSKQGAQYTIEGRAFSCGYTKVQGEAIATLCAACGASTLMNYGTDGSSTTNSNIAIGFTNHMGYDASLYFIDSWLSPTKAWMEGLIEKELQQKRPIYCCAATEEGGAHAFVIDGYLYKGTTPYYHVNWGWNGQDNGYFLLDAMTTSGGNNYSYQYTLTMNIKPDDGKDDGVLFAAKKISASVIDGKIILNVEDITNRTTKDFCGGIIIYAVDGQNKEYVLKEFHWDSWKGFNGYGTWDNSIDIPQGLPTGEYTIVLRTKEDGASVEREVLTSYSPTINIENTSAIDDATITERQNPEIYSLTGRKVSSSSPEELPKGLYIINGKTRLRAK